MSINIAINGFGRIGRAAFKIALTKKNIKICAINDLMDVKTMAHLLKYDSVYGPLGKKIEARSSQLVVDKDVFPVLAEKDPVRLPWKKMKIDVVLECTGFFTSGEGAAKHIMAGAKRVIISAPASDETTQTVVFGTTHSNNLIAKKQTHPVVSNASCTTNCISPVMQVLETRFGVEKAVMSTIHSYTADQVLVDGPHRDLRRARAAALNIVPTSTGAALATTQVLPSLRNKFDGLSIRVPTPCVSLTDITAVLKKNTTVEQINKAFKAACLDPMLKNILAVTDEPAVSSDFKGSPYSAIVDLECTRVIDGNLVKILAWYDNEHGYSCRLVELAETLGR